MDGLKQRIIGALVLVSLAVIFVPMMFDEPHSERESTSIKIPEEPPFPEVEAPEPEIPETPAYRIEEPGMDDEQVAAPELDTEEAPQSASTAEEQVAQPETGEQTAQEPVEEAPQEPVTDEDAAEFTRSLEGAWVVQLGSFGSGDNARNLRDKVREKGYNSHLQQITRGDTELTRVFSGPFAEKAEAERAKQVLDKAFGLNSLVTSGDK
ncbi:SPOR domain-containing protein [Marinobacter sp. TBZ242]|uniref:SPOR domain-containing protein n=1 Tax=Marinobacter azerbaijanicus TaxID=3050455 RepID=A0ABT7I8X7_9GAMM|nr:SPOR domain-containing protein [Marinobacter sp. TBZ242]MDL0429629.1 SPOR domain-containing protein [Marinobacter sp. TBZ242]